jgi:hypothetical protein
VTTLKRMVTDVVAADGQLEPGDLWRLEWATGETRVHRQFTQLVDADDKSLVRFASRHGLLGMRTSSLVHQQPEPHWQEQALRMGQTREDDVQQALEWVRNPQLPYPLASDDILKVAAVFADMMPEADLWAMAAFVGDVPLLEAAGLLDVARRASEAPALPVRQLLATNFNDRLRPVPSPRLRTALEIIQAFGERLGRDTRFEDRPQTGPFGRMLATVIATLPDVFRDHELTTEPIAEWRRLAVLLSDWIAIADLLRSGRVGRLEALQWRRLVDLLEKRAEWAGPRGRSQPEVVDLAAPIVRARLEYALTLVGAWPPSSSGPTPLYARLLLQLWRDVTDERWPKRCAEPGCAAQLPAHRKNSLCVAHAAERQRRRVMARRAAATSRVTR